ncbi:MAG TPA: hypothetical protein VK184_11440 [Nostocaceae cyanobacterium]|nr:hypothetical protein [Nostocaceae cyanobacterium]
MNYRKIFVTGILACFILFSVVIFNHFSVFANSTEDLCSKIRSVRLLAQAERLNEQTLIFLERKYCFFSSPRVTPRVSRKEGEIRIFGAKGSEYLGCWNCDQNDSDSVFNPKSFFRDLKNRNSIYGDVFSDYAACNTFGKNPPILEFTLSSGSRPATRYLGHLSLNAFQNHSICNTTSQYYWSQGCQDLRNYCSF